MGEKPETCDVESGREGKRLVLKLQFVGLFWM